MKASIFAATRSHALSAQAGPGLRHGE